MPLSQSDGRLQLQVMPWQLETASGVASTTAISVSPGADSGELGPSPMLDGASDAESPGGDDVASPRPEASGTDPPSAHCNVSVSQSWPAVQAIARHVAVRSTHRWVLGTQTEPLGQFAAPGRHSKDGIVSLTRASQPPLP